MNPRALFMFVWMILLPLVSYAQDVAVAPPSQGGIQGMLDSVLQTALLTIGTVLSGLIVMGAKKFLSKLHVEMTATQEAALRAKVRNAIIQVEQTYASKIRNQRSDGKLTGDEAISALGQSLEIATRDLGQAGLKKLGSLTGKGQDALREVVEEEIGVLKLIPKA